MYSLGLSLGDVDILANYEESGWLLRELFEVKRKQKTIDLIQMAEAVRMGTIGASSKENYALYKTWLENHQESIRDKEISGEETLFDKFKKQSKKKRKPLTFWEQRRLKKG